MLCWSQRGVDYSKTTTQKCGLFLFGFRGRQRDVVVVDAHSTLTVNFIAARTESCASRSSPSLSLWAVARLSARSRFALALGRHSHLQRERGRERGAHTVWCWCCVQSRPARSALLVLCTNVVTRALSVRFKCCTSGASERARA